MALTVDEARQLVALTDKIIDLENLNAELLELVRRAGPDGAVDLLFHNHDRQAHPELVDSVSQELAQLVAGHEVLAEAHPLLTARLLDELADHDLDQEAHPHLSAQSAQSLAAHEADDSAHAGLGQALIQSLTGHEDDEEAHPGLSERLEQKLSDHQDDQSAHPALGLALTRPLAEHEADAGAHPEVRAALARTLADHAADGTAHPALKTALTQSLAAHENSAEAHAALAAKMTGQLTDHGNAAEAHPAVLAQATANLGTHNNDGSAHVALRASAAEAVNVSLANKFLSPATLELARPRLTADRTYYVRSTGNDANTGLTSAAALKTIEAALRKLPGLQSQGFGVTIDIGPGSWASLTLDSSRLGALRRLTLKGSGPDTIIGGSGTAIQINYLHGDLRLESLSVKQSTTGGLKVTGSGRVLGRDLTFYLYATADLIVCEGSTLELAGTTEISNPLTKTGKTLLNCTRGGRLIVGGTLTMADTVTVSPAAVAASGNSYLEFGAAVSGGTKASGPRYSVSQNSFIFVGGAGANYLPGNAAGSIATGGGYA